MQKLLRQAGFTIAELIIGMAVISILAGIGAPNLSKWMDNYRIKAAARELYSDLQLARMQAIKKNQTFKGYFVSSGTWSAYYVIECKKTLDLCWPDGGTYYGPNDPLNDWDYTWNYLSMDSDERIQFKHPQGFSPVQGNWAVYYGVVNFNPNGTTDGTADIYVSNSSNTKNYLVSICSRAGSITVESYDGTYCYN